MRPNIREFKAHSIVFDDGKELQVDAVILATGYDVRDRTAGDGAHRDGMPDANVCPRGSGPMWRRRDVDCLSVLGPGV